MRKSLQFFTSGYIIATIFLLLFNESLVFSVTVTDVNSFLKASAQQTLIEKKKVLMGGCLNTIWSTHNTVLMGCAMGKELKAKKGKTQNDDLSNATLIIIIITPGKFQCVDVRQNPALHTDLN